MPFGEHLSHTLSKHTRVEQHGSEATVHTQAALDFAELGKFLSEPLRTYSAGMRARFVFALSLAYMRSSSPDRDGKTPGGFFSYDRGDRDRDDESPFR